MKVRIHKQEDGSRLYLATRQRGPGQKSSVRSVKPEEDRKAAKVALLEEAYPSATQLVLP